MIRINVREEANEVEEFLIDADFDSTANSTPGDIINMAIKAMRLEGYMDTSIIRGLEVNMINLKSDIKVNSKSLTDKEDKE